MTVDLSINNCSGLYLMSNPVIYAGVLASVNYSGLSTAQLAAIEPLMARILNDVRIQDRLQDSGVNLLSFDFVAGLSVATPFGIQQALARLDGGNSLTPSGHFNLHAMNLAANGSMSFGGKPFEITAIHEVLHAIYPNLSGEGAGHNNPAGDYLFRVAVIETSLRIFGYAHQSEYAARDRAFGSLMTAENLSPSGIDWAAIQTTAQVDAAIANPIVRQFLEPSAQGAVYDLPLETEQGNYVANVLLPSADPTDPASWTPQVTFASQQDTGLPPVTISNAQIGSSLGSTIGQSLVGASANPFARVAAGSGLSAVLGTVGQALDIYNNPFGSGDLNAAIGSALSNFNVTLGAAIAGQAVGALSSFLTAELAQSLGVNGSTPAGALFTYATGSVTTSVLNNVLYSISSQLSLFNGLEGVLFPGNGFTPAGFGAFIGGYLAREVLPAVSSTGAIGGQIGGTATPPLGFWVAAVRETFEEAGILLARPAGHPATTLAGGTAARRLVERARARPQGEIAFADLLAAEGLSPALDTLVHFGHWITPAWAPRRFDTHFFLVAAPDGQSVDLDVGESASALWTRPADMLAEIEAGKRTLVAVTRFTLELLATYGGVAEAIAAARQRPVVTVQPIRETGPDGTLMLRIPRHAGYPRWEMPAKGA